MTVSPEEHAARLKMIRRMGGMLFHPETTKVINSEQFGKIHEGVMALVECTCSMEDFLDHARAGAKDLVVKWSADRERFVFDYAESRAQ